FHLETLLRFDEYGFELVYGFYDMAPDWVVTHGHLGLPLSQLAGRSAMRAANKIGKSVKKKELKAKLGAYEELPTADQARAFLQSRMRQGTEQLLTEKRAMLKERKKPIVQ